MLVTHILHKNQTGLLVGEEGRKEGEKRKEGREGGKEGKKKEGGKNHVSIIYDSNYTTTEEKLAK